VVVAVRDNVRDHVRDHVRDNARANVGDQVRVHALPRFNMHSHGDDAGAACNDVAVGSGAGGGVRLHVSRLCASRLLVRNLLGHVQRCGVAVLRATTPTRERVLFIGTQFSILYTSMYSPAGAASPCA
jgi:hypothetical protein